MAGHLVERYILRYDLDQKRPGLILFYKVRETTKRVGVMPPKEDAVYLSDMLRNEKPVFYWETRGKKWLNTSV